MLRIGVKNRPLRVTSVELLKSRINKGFLRRRVVIFQTESVIALPKFHQIGCDIKAFVYPGSHRWQSYCSYFSMLKAPELNPGLLHITGQLCASIH